MRVDNSNTGVTSSDSSNIVWADGVLEEIRLQAWEGYCAFGHGGLEIGGVLFGRRTEGAIVDIVAVAFESDHARGPGFVLSEDDDARLAALLTTPPDRTQGLEPVGWYRSFTRTQIRFTERDHSVQKYFPEDWQLTLGIKPTRLGPAGAIVWVGDPTSPQAQKQGEFQIASNTVEPEPAADELLPAPALDSESTEREINLAVGSIAALPPAPLPPRVSTTGRSRFRPLLWGPVAVLLALVLGAGVAKLSNRATTAATPRWIGSPIQLRAVRQNQELRIEWDHAARAVNQASRAILNVSDGTYRNSFELEALMLRTGNVVYHPQSADVRINLQLKGPRGELLAEESIRHLGPAEPARSAEARPRDTSPPSVEMMVVRPDSADRAALGKPFEATQPPPPIRLKPFAQVATTPRTSTETLPVPPREQASAQFNLLPPVPAQVSPIQAPAVQPPAPAPVPAPQPATPAYTGPRSGRLIWTGYLERRGVIEVDHGKVSIGALTGTLPGVPVDLRAFPAELGERGLVVFSDDGRLNPSPRVEAASAANGWNRTQFSYEPVRSRQIAVLETPNATNSYQRLVLRIDARACSVVVVEWRVR